MRLAEPVAQAWRADLRLGFARVGDKSILVEKSSEGPLVVQKPLYPDGDAVCHAIVVHPPGGIAGGDQLGLTVAAGEDAHALLTTPGAAKWYRSAGPWAGQSLGFDVRGTLEWLPRETIVFDGALAQMRTRVSLHGEASFIGWEILCLGRFGRGRLKMETRVDRDGMPLFVERGEVEGGGRMMRSPVGLGGRTVAGTLIATSEEKVAVEGVAVTRLPGLLIARYLGDSSEEALHAFAKLWKALRPDAVEPRIWAT